MKRQYTVTIKVLGGEPEISEFLELTAKIQHLGRIGANRTIPVEVDGDGSGQLTFITINTPNDFVQEISNSFPSMKKFKKEAEYGDKISIHSIGE